MRLVRTTVILLAALAATAACSQPGPDASSDWCADTIAALISERQRWNDYDKAHGAENEDLSRFVTPPNPPATAEQIDAAEQRLGKRLDRQLRNWLEHANGWEFVFGTTALFSTQQLTPDSPEREIFLEGIDETSTRTDEFGVDSFDDLIIIGTNDNQSDFILTTGCDDDSDCDSAPVWAFDGDIRTFSSLRDFLTVEVESLKAAKR
ncbi:SMI1/KNR4 family protein [Aldersonia sp. NBC_00410]|uniref:SMI1/KNR4 family protein n=1 Tax=Aldersonia sp. NBC_00410 TaxID=2975954 RepID=UPI00225C1F42|nr:SMI1/KNR4 family protein [Aldersonia sp. NBC_00410]MCX5044833.1 SMI1/KNR4 family protein [Aldersonia sp. NBC_00410]MCX5046320.1 SMI1/KNR4 family protein [Aldersonia sp. NBC_00410]